MQKSENPYKAAQMTKKEMLKKKQVLEIVPNMRGMEKYLKEITLKGPFSPLEMKIHSIVSRGSNKHVDIDHASVNSILLDSDHMDSHARYVFNVSLQLVVEFIGLYQLYHCIS